MSEKQPHNPEHKIEHLRTEQAPETHLRPEAQENHETKEQIVQEAAREAKERAHATEQQHSKETKETREHAFAPNASKPIREKTYKHTLATIQRDMHPTARMFSRAIHSPLVERTSDIVGNTVARPDAILSGAIFAFVAVTLLYLIAKFIGFSLSGSETITAFAAGWLVGILYDLIKTVFKNKR